MGDCKHIYRFISTERFSMTQGKQTYYMRTDLFKCELCKAEKTISKKAVRKEKPSWY